jgi:nitrate reductase gamma subunit
MSYINELLFSVYPYMAGAVFLLGSLGRFDCNQYTWRSGSTQMLGNKGMRLAGNLFHIGILLLFVGHFVGLLMPHSWYPYFGLTASSKQIMAVVAGGIFGTVTFVGLTMLLYRRMTNPRIRNTSAGSDIFIIWLLYAQLILGMISLPISWSHSDGSTMLLLSDWAQRIVTFQGGAAEAVANVHIVFKLHLFLGMTMFLVFPFTRLVHIWSAPVWYLGRAYQIVRVKKARAG